MNPKHIYRRLMSTRTGTVIAAVILLAGLIVLNLVVSLIPYHVTKGDISGVGMYSLSGTSKAFLRDLDEDVTIYCLTTNGDESEQLSTLFSRYTAESKHIRVQYVDVLNDTAFCEKYDIDADSVTESSMVIESAKRFTFVDYGSLLYYYCEASGKVSQAEYQYMYSIYSSQGATNFKTLYGFDFAELKAYYDGDGKITNSIEYVLRDDLSYNLTLSEDTADFVRSVSEPVTVSCIWKGDKSECKIAGVLDQCAALNPKITVRYVDPEKAENAAFIEENFDAAPDDMTLVIESAKRKTTVVWTDVVLYHHAKLGTLTSSQYASYLAMENQLYSSLGGQIPYGYCYSYYLAYTSGSTTQVSLFNITDVTAYFDGEETYTNAIDYVTQETIPHAYILTGSLGTPLSEKLTGFFTEAANDYELLDPDTTDEIPGDAAVVILYAPKRDLTAKEAETLAAYLSEGGHLLLFTDGEDTVFENLMGVLTSYGVSAGAETVRDSGDGAFLGSEDYLLPTVNQSHNINYYPYYAGYRVDMPSAHLLTVADKDSLPENVTVTNLLTTSKNGYITYTKVGEDGSEEQVTEKATYPLAVDIKNSETGASIVWYASTEILSDGCILTAEEEKAADEANGDSDKLCGNKYYVSLSVSYLGKSFTPAHKTVNPVSADVVDAYRYSISAVQTEMEYLDVTSLATVILIGILVVILIPGGILAVGFVVRSRRRKA